MADSDAIAGAVTELRAAPRTPMKRRAMLAIANGNAVDVRTADISSGGVGVIADIALIPGQSCLAQFEACFDNQKKQMLMRGTVVFCLLAGTEGFRIGIRAGQVDPDLIQYIHYLFQ